MQGCLLPVKLHHYCCSLEEANSETFILGNGEVQSLDTERKRQVQVGRRQMEVHVLHFVSFFSHCWYLASCVAQTDVPSKQV